MHDFDGQVLIVEAGADDIVHSQTPKNYADALIDNSKLTYKVMKDAPHGLDTPELNASYANLLTDWIKRHMS